MAEVQCKIVDLIKAGSGSSFSFEVTPNIKEDQLNNIDAEPLFYAITWHATLHECRDLDVPPLKLAIYLKRQYKNVLLHLSCNRLRKTYLNDLLLKLQKEGICSLFVILGESYEADTSDFKSSVELIRYIRNKTGDYFSIGVAGFPDREDKLKHLKDKVDSGADFIITQAFFDIQIYNNFLQKCKNIGITVPILPGIFIFEKEKELSGFLKLCKVHIKKEQLEDFKNQSGVEIISNLIDHLTMDLKANHFHLFTLDKLETTLSITSRIV